MNRECPIAIHCGLDFGNYSSEEPEVFTWDAIAYCCDGTLKLASSVISQIEADRASDRMVEAECPNCDDPQKYCADALCPEGQKLTTICTDTSQSDADALAAKAKDALLPLCPASPDEPIADPPPDGYYRSNCTCPDGVTDPHTVYSNDNQAAADAQCEAIPKTCPPHCNTEQRCQKLAADGTYIWETIPACTYYADTVAQANAIALAAACDKVNTYSARLSSLPPFLCLGSGVYQPVTISNVMTSTTPLWAVSSGTLPPGMIFSQPGNYLGLLSGYPSTPGSYTFTITVALGINVTVSRSYTIVIFGFTTLSELPGGTVGLEYTAQIEADGGSGNYNFTVVSGALPEGLSLQPTGFVVGTPTTEETALFTVAVTDLVTPTMQCVLEFQIDVAAGDPFDTSTVITAAKSHYVIGHDNTVIFGDTRCTSGSTYPTGVVFYKEGMVILGNGNCGIYGTADPYTPGVLAASKIVHGDLTGTGSYHDSSSGTLDVFNAAYWPGTVNVDAAALAAFQALKPTVGGSLAIDVLGTFTYNDASLSLSLLNGSTFVFQWTGGNFAIYKRHDDSIVPTGVFYFYVGTANPIAQVTLT